MLQLAAWGNNVAGNLDPASDEPYITSPRVICESRKVEKVLWTGWTSTIIKEADTDNLVTWGTSSLIEDGQGRGPAHIEMIGSDPIILGVDEPLAYFTEDTVVRSFDKPMDHEENGGCWIDVTCTGLGSFYTVSESGIGHHKTFSDMATYHYYSRVTHPALDSGLGLSLYATESRVLAFSAGPLGHLFELTEDQEGKVSMQLIEELEGLGVQDVVAGSANRFAVVTEAGDAYLIPKGSLEPELMEVEEETVRLVGVGSKFEVVVTEEHVWARGENNFSQLGLEGKETREEFVKHPYFGPEMVKRIVSVHCARWSTIICMQDA